MAVFEGHKSNIHFIFSFGSHLISLDEESTVRVWIVETTGTKCIVCIGNSDILIYMMNPLKTTKSSI